MNRAVVEENVKSEEEEEEEEADEYSDSFEDEKSPKTELDTEEPPRPSAPVWCT